ncbi:DUF6153 family protein [Saccharothrix carnea]|uniref:DUF6153 family protein n=1 Tax=Saccharothrix carnea TaxID=1280637 RepID=UPI001FE761F0|nr:DUF6153 family protein [Saccharothrix carnea]
MLHRFRTRPSQWALVWAVAFAVVGMHHLGTQEPVGHAATASAAATVVDCCDHASEEHTPVPTGQHDALHLCLAILCAALGLTLAVLALRARTVAERLSSLSTRAARPRSPPPRPGGAPARLAELCVLRL